MSKFGWVPNPVGVERFLATLPHPPVFSQAAPLLMADGQDGDVMPYLAWYDLELHNDDGSLWKAKGDEPPYIPQTGNNCTSEGLARAVDLLQAIHVARQQAAEIEAGADPTDMAWVFHRTAIEATYAFGLSKAGMSGDNGCFGGAMAQGGREIGFVTYKDLGKPFEESRSRLQEFANDPEGVVSKYGEKAAPNKVGSIALVKTVAEVRAALANGMVVTVASNVGYQDPQSAGTRNRDRDSKGICRRNGTWPHQMHFCGSIQSDGTPSLVIGQSWGPNMPQGPQPFRLPSYCFRAIDSDAQDQLDAADSYSIGLFPGFERIAPLPSHWLYSGFF